MRRHVIMAAITASLLLPAGPSVARDDRHGGDEHAEVSPGAGDWVAEYEVTDLGQEAAQSSRVGSGAATLPSCKGAAVDVRCRTVTLCEPDHLSSTGYMRHVYDFVRIHGHAFSPMGECEPSESRAVDVAGQVAAAFRRIPLSPQRLVIQPPGGKTLVNFDTIFSADATPFTSVVRLLGRRVELRIRPATFQWVHGDGTTQTSHHPGRAYTHGASMSDYITHQYTDADARLTPRVDTTYTADFRVGTGPWRAVDGTVTIPGVPGRLQVVEARPVLVGTH